MKLNVEKIDSELKRLGKSRYWLAKQMGRSQQIVSYWLNSKSLQGAEPIAAFLGYSDPKDLII